MKAGFDFLKIGRTVASAGAGLRRGWLAGLLGLFGLGVPAVAQTGLTYAMDVVFSGTSPGTPAPWLTATFENNGPGLNGAGSVRLTTSVGTLPAGAYIDDLAFNLDPALNPAGLSFTLVGLAPAGVTALEQGVDVYKADGDGRYDLHFDFPNSNAGGGASRFTAGEVLVYDITGYAGLGAASFNFLSTPAGGNGPFHVAAHVNGFAGGSAWITGTPVLIPEPAAAGGLMAAMVAGAALLRRRAGSQIAA